jgi:hypothetical protein
MREKRMADAFMLVSPAEVNNQLENGTTRSVDREKEKAKKRCLAEKQSIRDALKFDRPCDKGYGYVF